MENKVVIALVVGTIVIGVSLYLLTGNPPQPTETSTTTITKTTTTLPTTSTASTITTLKELPLSELQITACNSADEGGTCDTKLPKLGLVTKEDCCKYLGKCC